MKAYQPWRIDSSDMPPHVLLMCKLMFIMLVVHGYPWDISDPFVPFLAFLDRFHQVPGLFEYGMTTLFVGAGLLLTFNVRARFMAIIMGLVMIATVLASKAFFRNHLFIAGCAFFLAGLSEKGKNPWLLYMQLALVYFGALVNKMFQLDWWNGQFMHNWLFEAFDNTTYTYIAGLLPEGWLAKLFSWASMLTELVIGILLLSKKRHAWALWTIILFHTTLFSITMTRFGHFFDDIVIFLLVFLNWPKTEIKATYVAGELGMLRNLLNPLNWNGQIRWTTGRLLEGHWLRINYESKEEYNLVALRSLLLYSPGFFVGLFLLDSGIRFVFPQPLQHFVSLIFYWGGILFFLPIRWKPLRNARPMERVG